MDSNESTHVGLLADLQLADLQLADREQLRILLKPTMAPASFSNWLHRAMRSNGFPEPIRTGRRACDWSILEVRKWLQGRPRKGVFSGRRRVVTPPAQAG